MLESLKAQVVLGAILIWPVIPLFWIPVHCAPRYFRRLGLLTYVLPALTWIPTACTLYSLRHALLAYRLALSPAVNLVGVVVFVAGMGLQVWTLVLLTGPVIAGMPEVTYKVQSKLMTRGPFGVIRHPTYLSHTLMFLGLFLWTARIAMVAVTVLDLILVLSLIIPLEERELLERFGKDYERYRNHVPSRFIPWRR